MPKISDYKPCHFENGRDFDADDFAAFIQASEDSNSTFLTRYLPLTIGGLALGAICAFCIGGTVGYLLAIVCIFGGFIAGTYLNKQASKKFTESMERLGITKDDVAAAWQHVKAGTVAWSDDEETPAA